MRLLDQVYHRVTRRLESGCCCYDEGVVAVRVSGECKRLGWLSGLATRRAAVTGMSRGQGSSRWICRYGLKEAVRAACSVFIATSGM